MAKWLASAPAMAMADAELRLEQIRRRQQVECQPGTARDQGLRVPARERSVGDHLAVRGGPVAEPAVRRVATGDVGDTAARIDVFQIDKKVPSLDVDVIAA